jgi:hypothetical protein
MPAVTEPLKLIPYYFLNHSTWPLSNNFEVTCRLYRVKPGKSLTSQDRQLHNKTHTKASPEVNNSQFITIHPSKVHYYKPGHGKPSSHTSLPEKHQQQQG